MIDYAMLERLQAEAEEQYARSVEATEAELGLDLPRFHETRFVFSRFGRGQRSGSSPFYRQFAVPERPRWETDAYALDGLAALSRFEAEHEMLRHELLRGAESAGFVATDTGYHGTNEAWQAHVLVTEDGNAVEDALAPFPRMADILSGLIEHDYACRTFFARMLPGAHLPPHCGGQNIYL